MNYYRLDYTIEKVLQDSPSREQKILLELAGENFPKEEAKVLWEKVQDHKWYVSERLRRDVGFRVAAVDFIENFYEPNSFSGSGKRKLSIAQKILQPINSSLHSYFVSKSKILSQ
jgi:hypothetical protein